MTSSLTHDAALGTATALGSAVLWAFSSPMLSKAVRRYGSPAINLYKSVVAAALFLATMAVWLGLGAFEKASASLPWFALSGVVGLAIGDTAYFVSLGRLGPALALILYQLSAVFGLLLGVAFRGEKPHAAQIAGTLLVVGGVVFATVQRRTARDLSAEGVAAHRERRIGVIGGLISAACQAVGLLINQRGFDAAADAGYARFEPSTASLASAARMTATAVALLFAVAVLRRFRAETRPLVEREGWKLTFVPALLGTYVGILTMQVAIANLPLGVASTLLATSPIFVIPAAWLMTGERPTVRKTVGALVATGGVALISLAS
jgi:drug/metabolite transporter (DMT)-like permease